MDPFVPKNNNSSSPVALSDSDRTKYDKYTLSVFEDLESKYFEEAPASDPSSLKNFEQFKLVADKEGVEASSEVLVFHKCQTQTMSSAGQFVQLKADFSSSNWSGNIIRLSRR